MSGGYYDDNAKAYFDATIGADVAALRDRFLSCLRPGARILDAGCGSGRDLRAFADAGFEAVGFDASRALANLAELHSGCRVLVGTFETMTFDREFDGVWACASLLHVVRADLREVLRRCVRALRAPGVLYASFKHGGETRSEGARVFTDVTEAELEALCVGAGLAVADLWITPDVRPGRAERWVNVIARRMTDEASRPSAV